TAGVDSFYTLLKHREEITTLIYVHGFDVPLENLPVRAKVSSAIRAVAAELGKDVVEVETNLKEFSDHYGRWAENSHGAALASVALLLSPQFERVYLAASHTYVQMTPWGSYPMLDPLWSTEATEIVHDGCESTRTEKIASLRSCETVLRWLRVCWENRNGAYNCGECEKCLRNMIVLRVAGLLQSCVSFDRPLDLEKVSQIVVADHNKYTLRENLNILERTGQDPALAEALRACFRSRRAETGGNCDRLREQINQNEAEIARLRGLVQGYERGRAMRVLNAVETVRQRIKRFI
ncbi:MAG TPA: hypothetical protein VFZ25_10970, partial [Chloroflexota bacterium]|nr:hypothetical protein [Chloroflexota bacterium]